MVVSACKLFDEAPTITKWLRGLILSLHPLQDLCGSAGFKCLQILTRTLKSYAHCQSQDLGQDI